MFQDNGGSAKRLWTIGYGGRKPDEFLRLLLQHGVKTIADVRLRPDRASMGSYTRSRSPEKGIEKLFATAGIEYVHFLELGNVFLDDIFDIAWKRRYGELLRNSGDLLLERLIVLASNPVDSVCLLCAEQDHRLCHREEIAEAMQQRGFSVVHIR